MALIRTPKTTSPPPPRLVLKMSQIHIRIQAKTASRLLYSIHTRHKPLPMVPLNERKINFLYETKWTRSNFCKISQFNPPCCQHPSGQFQLLCCFRELKKKMQLKQFSLVFQLYLVSAWQLLLACFHSVSLLLHVSFSYLDQFPRYQSSSHHKLYM